MRPLAAGRHQQEPRMAESADSGDLRECHVVVYLLQPVPFGEQYISELELAVTCTYLDNFNELDRCWYSLEEDRAGCRNIGNQELIDSGVAFGFDIRYSHTGRYERMAPLVVE